MGFTGWRLVVLVGSLATAACSSSAPGPVGLQTNPDATSGTDVPSRSDVPSGTDVPARLDASIASDIGAGTGPSCTAVCQALAACVPLATCSPNCAQFTAVCRSCLATNGCAGAATACVAACPTQGGRDAGTTTPADATGVMFPPVTGEGGECDPDEPTCATPTLCTQINNLATVGVDSYRCLRPCTNDTQCPFSNRTRWTCSHRGIRRYTYMNVDRCVPNGGLD